MQIPEKVKTDALNWTKTNSQNKVMSSSLLNSIQEGDFAAVAEDIKEKFSRVPKSVWIGLAVGGVLAAGAITYKLLSKAKDAAEDASERLH